MPISWENQKGRAAGRRAHRRRKSAGRRRTDRRQRRRRGRHAKGLGCLMALAVSCGMWAAILVPLIVWL